MTTYDLGHSQGQHNITCRLCSMTSYHPEDVRQRYCGYCHLFHGTLSQWLNLTQDPHPEIAAEFTGMINREIMPTRPSAKQDSRN